MQDFVSKSSVVRTIWGNADTILLIFAGSAGEFAVNRAVDWLFFTGKLPKDPVGRFFSTVRYAQEIVFADQNTAQRTLQRISKIHSSVERRRSQQIPDWANRDVLYMLIDYSERAFRLLERPLTASEQQDLYDVFYRVGVGLGVQNLPTTYKAWQHDRQQHLQRDLIHSHYTDLLYQRYREQLSWWRYGVLLQVQGLIVPAHVRHLLRLPRPKAVGTRQMYYLLRQLGLRSHLQRLMVPPEHLAAVQQLDWMEPSLVRSSSA